MSVGESLKKIKSELPAGVKLIAVTKTKPVDLIFQAYHSGHKIFGENKVQEMVDKKDHLPEDVEWHLIGHLQSNKVKYIAPFVHLIHSADSLKLLNEINKQALKNNRTINVLLQIHIASEETKFGLSFQETRELIHYEELEQLKNIQIKGLMGMATFTEDENIIRKEFRSLKNFFEEIKSELGSEFTEISMGMSSDYQIAIQEGSTMVRVGSAIFGER